MSVPGPESAAPAQLDDLASIDRDPNRLQAAFAVIRDLRQGVTRKGEAFVDLRLGDQTAVVGAKVWSGSSAIGAAADLTRGEVVKVLFQAREFQGALQLDVRNLRRVGDGDDCDPARLFGDGWELVRDVACARLVFDIETVPGVDRRKLPATVVEALAKHAERVELEESTVMSLSPFFGKVVSLAFADADGDTDDRPVTVLVVPPAGAATTDLPGWIRPMSEADLLRAWWALAANAETIVSYNGRGFDVPFLVGRSLVHGIPARVDLLSNRFSLRPHLDLYRALTHGERSLGPAKLDVVCWALGIRSPKGEMDGSMVAEAYAKGQLERIAQYNAEDVRATAAVYRVVRDHLLRFRDDW